jgi:hypothetical protein
MNVAKVDRDVSYVDSCTCMLQVVGVWSCEGPEPRSESVLRVPNLDGDARRVHGGLSWFGQKKGGVLYFLAPKCLRRGYKL